MTPLEMARLAVEAAEGKKAKDLLLLDISHITLIADYFLLANGNTPNQVRAIAKGIEDCLGEKGVLDLRRHGYSDGRWVLLDYGAMVVHVFNQEERSFYGLERLWADAGVIYSSEQEGWSENMAGKL